MSLAQTMSAQHHPGEDVLWDYYRGALTPGQALTVATHLDLCPKCRVDLRLFDRIGAAMLDGIDAVPMSENALDLALARIERPEVSEAASAKPAVRQPAFLEGFELPDSLKTAAIKGRYWAAPGVWLAPIALPDAPKGSKTYLMYVKKGMVMPEHTHTGREITVMLKGRFSDNRGTYATGDFACADDSDCHAPAMSDEEDCMCLITQESPIVPLTLLGKFLQPFARI